MSEKLDKKTGELYESTLSRYNSKGEELPDSRPMALPVGFRHPRSLQDRMRYLLRSELLRRELDASGIETFEEADDFKCGEDDLPGTPYEDHFEPELPGFVAREQEIRAGQVMDRPTEKKEKAREHIRKYKKHIRTDRSGGLAEKSAKKPTGSEDQGHETDEVEESDH